MNECAAIEAILKIAFKQQSVTVECLIILS